MFILYAIKDEVCISPSIDPDSFTDEVALALERKYVGKVLSKEGLCICLYELQTQEVEVATCTGDLQCNCEFTLVVFKPFPGEIVTGTIKSCSKEEGITVSLGFVEAHVPARNLHHPAYLYFPCSFDREGLFAWQYEPGVDLFYEYGAKVRFSVVSFDTLDDSAEDLGPKVELIGDMAEDGLGPETWWTS